ncbi:cytochrome c oxidase accessory protein CcoG [Alkalilimnicola ehrlichii]|uniref:cytochrome c oxidase accessory protein CcoG n=1 Tax=Alkalilimnicola ehrlichii TaxID=351052 RepID=UPI002161DF95|nr:cytochrome c oxidase accessory protein CcoG [Alkalilimnicola ehrlichii]
MAAGFFYLALLLIIAALALFFFTALAGRLWCGYACPQTVWTEVFLWLERITEGPRHKRIKLDESPWTREKLLRKTAKQTLWIGFAGFTGFVFVGYFVPVDQLWQGLITLQLGPWEWFWGIFYGLATYGNAGYLREQVCLYMCPYARFQSVMFDKNSLIISYDAGRGEPRGGRKRGIDPASRGLGDCIDCNLCVQACPTGIDIRQGLQYECIACAACVDACDSVMDKMGYQPGLIRYTSENALQGRAVRLLRPRVIVYALLLLALSSAFVVSIALRSPINLEVQGDRNVLFRELNDGRIENIYTLTIMNKGQQDSVFTLTASGIPGLEVTTRPNELRVAAGQVATATAWVRVEADALQRPGADILFRLSKADDPAVSTETQTRFHGPLRRP